MDRAHLRARADGSGGGRPRKAARLSVGARCAVARSAHGRRRDERPSRSRARRGFTRSSAIRSSQVRSPEVFTERFAAAGIDAVLVPAHVPADRFDDDRPGAAWRSAISTDCWSPCRSRRASLRFADRLGATATCIGALNALRREADGSWTGDMFDGAGFVRGAERKGERVRGRRVALFGAGGAGSAIACALAGAGRASIDIIDPDAGTRRRARREAAAGVSRRARWRPRRRKPRDVDMIVNASPVGMQPGDGMPGDIGPLTRRHAGRRRRDRRRPDAAHPACDRVTAARGSRGATCSRGRSTPS